MTKKKIAIFLMLGVIQWGVLSVQTEAEEINNEAAEEIVAEENKESADEETEETISEERVGEELGDVNGEEIEEIGNEEVEKFSEEDAETDLDQQGEVSSLEWLEDAVFRKYIADNFDLNQDGWLSDEEKNAVKVISVNNMGIQKISNLSWFQNLEELYCSGNSIQYLSLGDNTKLRVLECNTNVIKVSSCYLELSNWTENAENEGIISTTNLVRQGINSNRYEFIDYTQNALYKYNCGNGFSIEVILQCPEPVTEGKAGDTIRWKYDEEKKTLSFEGNGDIDDYSSETMPDWTCWKEEIRTLEFDDEITRIGDYAFYGFEKIETALTLPQKLKSIGKYTFSGCKNINGNLIIPGGVTDIREGAFSGCKSLTGDLSLPKGLMHVWNNAFRDCRGLNGKLVLNEGISYLEEYAFANCNFTGELYLPKSIKRIGYRCFSGCNGFHGDLTIPAGANVFEGAFEAASGLGGTLILEECETKKMGVYGRAFLGCTGFKAVVVGKGEKFFDTSVFSGCSANLIIYGTKGTATEEYAEEYGIHFEPIRGITLFTQPKDIKGEKGKNVEVGVTADGCGLTYKWEMMVNNQWRSLSGNEKYQGVNAETLKIMLGDEYKQKFRCRITDILGGEVVSDVVQVSSGLGEQRMYEDVPNTPGWRYEAIKYVTDHGIMNGISGTNNFDPDSNLKREMFATIIYRMEGSPPTSYDGRFPDVKAPNYYVDPISWASQCGIINGHSNTGLFGVHEDITREDLVVIMYRYSQYKSYNMSGSDSLSRFPDVGDISGYAKPAMQWAVANGIVNGRSNTGMLDPKGNATRVEAAAIIQRFMQKYVR